MMAGCGQGEKKTLKGVCICGVVVDMYGFYVDIGKLAVIK
jgi:hypothetical protein